jgi:hypothetical protein
MRTPFGVAVLIWLGLGLAACSAAPPVVLPTTTAASATATLNPDLPITEAGVDRVTPENAKRAFDSGEAIIVDVRTGGEYAARHITGAALVPLADIERDPTGVPLDKAKWIITYCT